MLSAEQIRLDIAQKRVAYGWKIFQNHGIVDVDAEVPILEPNGVPLEDIAAELFPDRKPEAFDIHQAVQVDLAAFEEILAGEYEIGIPPNTQTLKRDSTIQTDSGDIDCAHLAFAGVLTDGAYHALQRKDLNVLERSYSIHEVSKLIGTSRQSMNKGFDRQTCLLFDQHETFRNDHNGFSVDKTNVKTILREANSVVSLSEVVAHLKNVKKTSSLKRRRYAFAKDPQSFVAPEDPYYSFGIEVGRLFDIRPTLDLTSLDALMNVVSRDQRILDTHYGLEEAGEKLGRKRQAVRRNKLLTHRKTYFLSGTGGNALLFCDDDIETCKKAKRKIEEGYISLTQLFGRLQRAGVIHNGVTISAYLKEKRLLPKRAEGPTYLISNEDVDEMISTLRTDEKYSQDYRTYCSTIGISLEEGLESFERNFDKFNRSKEIALFLLRELDLTYKGTHLKNLDPREHDVEAIVGEIVGKNQKVFAGLKAMVDKGNYKIDTAVCDGSKIYVPLMDGRLDVLSKGGPPRKSLLKQNMRKHCVGAKLFDYHEFIELSELLEVNTRIKNYRELLKGTIDTAELARVTGAPKNSLEFLVKRGMIPCVQVKTPYSSKALYRYTPKQVERIQGRTRQLTFTDIFKLAKREGIPFKERSLERYSVMFRDIYAPDKPEFDHAVGKYNYTYAFAFIEFMKKALGIKTKVDEFEQGKFILPRDLARAERLEKDAVLSVPIEEMSYGALHTLALYCKTHNGNTLAKRVADQLTDRFVDVALGKTRAKATDLREYAQRAIWDAFQTYDLYSGTPFMDHFKTYVTRTFAPDERRGYERHRKGDRLFSDPATKTDGDDRKFGDTLEDKGPDPETQLELAEQRHALYQSLGSLDETQRAVLLGFYFEDRSVLELAQQLGKDEAAVSSMLEDCIDHMRELMM